MTTELKQVSFPPEVLARIVPDVSLQRHLSIGLRPNLRNFLEFKPIEIASNENNLTTSNNNIFGSSIIKSGNTTVINTITLGIVENNANEKVEDDVYVSIYPVVDIQRGRSGAPSDEEMILSQNLFETILHSKLIPKKSLNIESYGLATNEDGDIKIFYPNNNETSSSSNEYEDFESQRKRYSFVLFSHIKVFSKVSTIFDLCHVSILEALKNVKLPRVYMTDFSTTKIVMKSRNSNTRGLVGINKNNINIDLNQDLYYDLELNGDGGVSSNFGAITTTNRSENEDEEPQQQTVELLADLEGEAEEATILSRVSIIVDKSERIKRISLINGDNNSEIGLDLLQKAIDVAKLRAKNV
ncbi:hypothetical protein DFJ63DRAFT_313243 [Scheffersomyces coipomensis]|uniref:uncharacterized protein n=1 Tax=Scheffersomyces coipomensis TaxID=1788519 RepID=UPI00315C52AB